MRPHIPLSLSLSLSPFFGLEAAPPERSFFSNPPTVFSGPPDLPGIGAVPGAGPGPGLKAPPLFNDNSLSLQLFSVALDGANPIERDVVPFFGVVMGAGPLPGCRGTWGVEGIGEGTDILTEITVPNQEDVIDCECERYR